MSISDYYILTITPSSVTTSSDGFSKSGTSSWANGATFSGRIRTLRGGEQIINESKKTVTTHRLYCPSNSITSATQRVTAGGKTYEVILPNTPQDRTTNHHMEIELRLVGE